MITCSKERRKTFTFSETWSPTCKPQPVSLSSNSNLSFSFTLSISLSISLSQSHSLNLTLNLNLSLSLNLTLDLSPTLNLSVSVSAPTLPLYHQEQRHCCVVFLCRSGVQCSAADLLAICCKPTRDVTSLGSIEKAHLPGTQGYKE